MKYVKFLSKQLAVLFSFINHYFINIKTVVQVTLIRPKVFVGATLTLFLQMTFMQAAGQMKLPSVIPPSPEATRFFQFLDYPIGPGTGIPDISIPLYEINSGSLTVPIYISYHAGGRKVFDETGAVGLGWVLNAGGMISRTVYGKPDDRVEFYSAKSAATLNNKVDYGVLTAATSEMLSGSGYSGPRHYDTEYDIFSYSFGSESGKFVVKQNNAVLMPAKLLKFNSSSFPSSAVDDKGVQYKFNDVENYHSTDAYFGNVISSRLLTSIISSDGRDTVNFIYSNFNKTDFNYTDYRKVRDNDNSTTTNGVITNSYGHNDYDEYNIKRLTEINFKEGKIKFLLHPIGNKDQIKSIQIWNSRNEVIRTIKLSSSLSDYPVLRGPEGVYKLDSLLFLDRSSKLAEKYSFDYMPSANFRTHDRDYWGYINSLYKINSLVHPSYSNIEGLIGYNGDATTTTFNIVGANRMPSNPQAGILQRINYPTGGSTEFTFESNLYAYGGNVNLVGPGLRVKQIKSQNANGLIHDKTYKYGLNECGYGTLPFGSIRMQDMSYEKRFFTGITGQASTTTHRGYRERTYTSEPLPQITDAFYEPIYYSEVTEYNGTMENNNGKTIYSYSQSAHGGSLNYYLSTIPIIPNSEPDIGQGVFSYVKDNNLNIRHIKQYDLWKKNLLISTKIFKKINGSNYELIKGVFNTYETTRIDTLKGLHIYKHLETSNDESAVTNFGIALYSFDDYTLVSGKQELASTSTINFLSTGIDSSSVHYFYNQYHLLDKSVSVNSKGESLNTFFKYPFDYGSNEILNYVIENSTFKGNVPLHSTFTTLQGTKPLTLSTKFGNNAYEPRIQYRYGVSKNLISVWKEGGTEVHYIYGYNDRFPIAEVMNSTTSNIAFTSFESNDTGNWNYSFSGMGNGGKTGTKSFIGSLNKSGLLLGKYTVSLWAKGGGSITVNGVSKSIDASWRLYEWDFSSINSIAINSNGNKIDEVRLHPVDAQMTTYTYEPLVGMTSETDAGGRTIYYEYDDALRLKNIKDQDGNILKNHIYHYKP